MNGIESIDGKIFSFVLGKSELKSLLRQYTNLYNALVRPNISIERLSPSQQMLFIGLVSCLWFVTMSASAISWRDCANQKGDWYKTPEAKRIGDNVLYFQSDLGGWYKNDGSIHPSGNAAIDGIVVTSETRETAERLNAHRAGKGLEQLEIIEVEHLLAEDGLPVSSSHIRAGEVDAEGRQK